MTNERYARADPSVTGQVLKIVALQPDAVMTGGAGTPGRAAATWRSPSAATRAASTARTALINPDFVRVGGAAGRRRAGADRPGDRRRAAARRLPDARRSRWTSAPPTRRSTARRPPTRFSAYSFDAWLVFARRRQARDGHRAKPGTPEFRVALRDAIFSTKEVVGTHGVYNFKPGDRYGVDERARVIVGSTTASGSYEP